MRRNFSENFRTFSGTLLRKKINLVLQPSVWYRKKKEERRFPIRKEEELQPIKCPHVCNSSVNAFASRKSVYVPHDILARELVDWNLLNSGRPLGRHSTD